MAKLLLEAVGVQKSYGLRTVLNIDRFELYDGERVGLVGENGAGKSTLLKILAGELEPDAGQVRRLAPIASIRQMGGMAAEISDGQLISEFAVQAVREGLSGGEQTRRRSAGALAARGQVLLADEPTTDLDAAGIARLERRLREYEGAIVLVSHDRALLDSLCTAIVQLQDGRLEVFPGNYSAYRAELENRRAHQQFEYDQYRAEQARLRAAIQGKKEHAASVGRLPGRMGNSEARLHRRSATEIEEKLHRTRKALQTRLEHLEEKERPREDPSIRMALGAFSPITARTALEVRGMTMRFGARVLLEDAGMKLPVGTRTALLGDNGCGKTTLLRRILSGRDPRVRVSPGVKPGWFDQDHAGTLDLEKTALENAMRDCVYDQATARTVLARLNMRGEDVFKRTGVLSGGERAKVALARLFLADINVLVLDEPTNHLDVFTLEALQGVLTDYAGTVLFVSHDRRFVEAVAGRLVFFADRKLVTFEGTLAEYDRRQSVDRSAEDEQLRVTTLQMRLAVLAARLSKPEKGDDPEALQEEYFRLAAQLRGGQGGQGPRPTSLRGRD